MVLSFVLIPLCFGIWITIFGQSINANTGKIDCFDKNKLNNRQERQQPGRLLYMQVGVLI